MIIFSMYSTNNMSNQRLECKFVNKYLQTENKFSTFVHVTTRISVPVSAGVIDYFHSRFVRMSHSLHCTRARTHTHIHTYMIYFTLQCVMRCLHEVEKMKA
jgi:hypothetical protein